jgi:hypothetical protein
VAEEDIVQHVQDALVKRGVSDRVIAAGEFNRIPLAHTKDVIDALQS